jgi:hypothetical protein
VAFCRKSLDSPALDGCGWLVSGCSFTGYRADESTKSVILPEMGNSLTFWHLSFTFNSNKSLFSTNISTEYFKHAAHSPFFSSKCRLFHNATFFGSSIIHILHTGVLKFKYKIPVPKG